MENKIFNIYYMNFDKVYEIKMILSNVIKISQENEITDQKNKDTEVSGNVEARLGTKMLRIFETKGNLDGNYRRNSVDTDKMIEKFEIKATKSVILHEVLEKSSEVNDFSTLKEGKLIRVDSVKLSLENEEELRTAKMVSSGMLKGLKIPEAQGLDVNNMFNSMFKDYAYKLKGITEKNENIIFKIPMTFENEFESNYSVDDLFIGNVSVLGIYKGLVNVEELRNTFEFFSDLGSEPDKGKDTSGIKKSHYEESSIKNSTEDKKRETYHYIDILGVLQNINIENLGESND